MSTIWIARAAPWDFFVRGIQRHRVFFEKPEFHPACFECPMFGPLEPKDYSHDYWAGDCVEFKPFMELFPDFADVVFQDTMDCYVDIPKDIDNFYLYLQDKLSHAKKRLFGDIRIGVSGGVEAQCKHDAYLHSLVVEAEKSIERPGKGWREHLLEYNIDLTLRPK